MATRTSPSLKETGVVLPGPEESRAALLSPAEAEEVAATADRLFPAREPDETWLTTHIFGLLGWIASPLAALYDWLSGPPMSKQDRLAAKLAEVENTLRIGPPAG